MSTDDRKMERPARERGTQSTQDVTGPVAGRAASISNDVGKDDEGSPGAEADRKEAEKH